MQPGQGYPYPEASGATASIVVAILGIMFCQLLSPVAWVMARKELDGIEAGRRDPINRGEAKVAYVLGIIGTVLVGLALSGLVMFLILVSVAAS